MESEENNELGMKENIPNNNSEYNKKANKLCIISILLNVVPYTFMELFTTIFTVMLNPESNIFLGIFEIYSLALRICPVLAFIIMIYVRVKYPKNEFGKVLMIFYIVSIIIFMLLYVFLVFTCSDAVKGCPGY